ncbi:hypothetical protein [Parasedimentitalea denitrificans]|uniref:hypothetical protein n=1 Tax=Parasedimentitalea denitrificans TaxID=2211118 RepID=UPI001430C296|nr:hypothetical protein [Sedimentitalea sp. CY04]
MSIENEGGTINLRIIYQRLTALPGCGAHTTLRIFRDRIDRSRFGCGMLGAIYF